MPVVQTVLRTEEGELKEEMRQKLMQMQEYCINAALILGSKDPVTDRWGIAQRSMRMVELLADDVAELGADINLLRHNAAAAVLATLRNGGAKSTETKATVSHE